MHPVKFRFFLLQKLPSALIAGLKVQELSSLGAVITVKHKWLNQNPFRSMYFAVQSMAAEMSTGLLAFGQLYQRNPAVSMLVVGMEAKFHKKAVGNIAFECMDGIAIANAVEAATQTGQGQTIQCYSIGKNEAGETVSEFWFTWSFKAK
ncbi:MAG: hypothetical protein CFE25_12905 [Chitinophagaceae bacterium BSSC1]|nr:MAG: hypothetical protein CFE25_12905 [Chitinophagaceae bacterium BSSC1]